MSGGVGGCGHAYIGESIRAPEDTQCWISYFIDLLGFWFLVFCFVFRQDLTLNLEPISLARLAGPKLHLWIPCLSPFSFYQMVTAGVCH